MKAPAVSIRNIWEKNWPELHAALCGGLPRFIYSSHPKDLGANVSVFSYHAVSEDAFESDLDFLSHNGYETLDADTLLGHLIGRKKVDQRSVILSFDDGTRNLYECVYPLLRHYNMKGVAFIAPKYHREEDEKTLPAEGKNIMRPLSWQQIREMHASGVIDFQSHTYEHRYIPRWPEPAELEGSDPEVVRSLRGPALTIAEDFKLAKETIESQLNKEVKHLAFPKFKATEEALLIGQEIGYRAFWWGVLPKRSGNRPGQEPSFIVRIDGRYLRRLPGNERMPLSEILLQRYRSSPMRLLKIFQAR